MSTGIRFRALPGALALAALAGIVIVLGIPHGTQARIAQDGQSQQAGRLGGGLDQPNPRAYAKVRERQSLLEQQAERLRLRLPPDDSLSRALQGRATVGTDRILVILVEFGGPDTFTWTPGVSTWDPIGKADTSEYTGKTEELGTPAACNNIITKHDLTTTRTFTYNGPLRNQIERPRSEEDRSGDTVWTPDFNSDHYRYLIFGDGVTLSYTRQDGSDVHQDFRGKSVAHYFKDMSANRYQIVGDVIGWVQLPHSTWWYGADPCPGTRSGASSVKWHGGIPDAGNADQLVIDAIEAVKAVNPGFNWSQYDRDGDGLLDHLWIIHAGLGEEDAIELLNRTDYGEAGIWSHAGRIDPAYPIAPGLAVDAYVVNPENSGIAVLAHEHSHALGAIDLYNFDASQRGHASAGIWTLMADDWIGTPLGFMPQSYDPWHLDNWGWLDPRTITDPMEVYTVTLGQASDFPEGGLFRRAAKIVLPAGETLHPVEPNGSYQWWGGREHLKNATMTLKQPIKIASGLPFPFLPGGSPAASASAKLTFKTAFDIGTHWDFLWLQVSADGGKTWQTLTNEHTTCKHGPEWIGGQYGFPEDLCSAGIGGFTGTSPDFPAYTSMTFDLKAFAGKDILLRFWYMTDATVLWKGAYVDDIEVQVNEKLIFSDDAESGDTNWTYAEGWERNDGTASFSHNYYLQWRNVSLSEGYDSALGLTGWRFGPANTGLLVWYNNNWYPNNDPQYYRFEYPSFGPKGRMMLVDAHPEPYRDPYWLDQGFENEKANVTSRSLMRDAPFSLEDSVDFVMQPPFVHEETRFEGREALAVFSDAFGYYPGAEYVSLGPGKKTYWVTADWDASVVIPSTQPYGIKAPEYRATDALVYYHPGTDPYYPQEGGTLIYLTEGGLGIDGGTGNPGDVDGEYGWNCKILSQTDAYGIVGIWNRRYTLLPRTLRLQKTGSGRGTVSDAAAIDCGSNCAAMYKNNTLITLRANPEPNSLFQGWSGACSGLDSCTLRLDADMSVGAQFVSVGCPIPDAPNTYSYPATSSPVVSLVPSECQPFAVGDLSTGMLSMRIKLPPFAAEMDVYVGLYLPTLDPANLYLIKAGNEIQAFSAGLAPWSANTTGDFESDLLGSIPLLLFPKGTCYLFLLVTPAGDASLARYYLWITSFERE